MEKRNRIIRLAFYSIWLAASLLQAFITPLLEDEAYFYHLIREVLVANLRQHPPQICIEVGRQNTPGHNRPGFDALEEALKATRDAA